MISAVAFHRPPQLQTKFYRGSDGKGSYEMGRFRVRAAAPPPPQDELEGPKIQGTTATIIEDEADFLKTTNPIRTTSAPLVDALRACAKRDVADFQFPGHNRGRGAPPCLTRLLGTAPFQHDLPPMPETDNLFFPKGVILDAQRRASSLFGSSETWFLVGSTTCGVQAAIMATCSCGETLILPRNAHVSAISGMVLSGAVPKYVIPEYSDQWDVTGGITASQVERAIRDLAEDGKKAGAVLVTSPTYHGVCSDLREMANLCHSHNIPFIVDEAHGPHFKFHHRFPNTALEQGADLVVQSTHKVLGSLSQSSMLHSSGNLVDGEKISRSLQMLQSTSPNYLLLASLDAARAHLAEKQETLFDGPLDLAAEAGRQIEQIPGFSLLGLQDFVSEFPALDPLRITVGVWQLNMTGYEVNEYLNREHGILTELSGSNSLNFPINIGSSEEDIRRLVVGLRRVSATFFPAERVLQTPATAAHSLSPFENIDVKISPRDAFFAEKRKVNFSDSVGEISGELISPYPPGSPVLAPGEAVTETALSYLLDAKKKGARIVGASDHQLSSLVVCNL